VSGFTPRQFREVVGKVGKKKSPPPYLSLILPKLTIEIRVYIKDNKSILNPLMDHHISP